MQGQGNLPIQQGVERAGLLSETHTKVCILILTSFLVSFSFLISYYFHSHINLILTVFSFSHYSHHHIILILTLFSASHYSHYHIILILTLVSFSQSFHSYISLILILSVVLMGDTYQGWISMPITLISFSYLYQYHIM